MQNVDGNDKKENGANGKIINVLLQKLFDEDDFITELRYLDDWLV